MQSTPQHPKSTTTVFLDQPPSCLQFCPSSPNHFIVGTYLLTELKSNTNEQESIQQTKTGSLQLWALDPTTDTLSLIQRIPLPYAVFDLHFHPRDPSILAIAGSAGSVALFKVSLSEPESESSSAITSLWTRPVHDDSSTPALFLAWAPEKWCPRASDAFAVTFSDGRTTVFGTKGPARITEEKDIVELGRFEAKQPIEVWFVALATAKDESDDSNPEVPFLFTGNDFGSVHTRRFEIQGNEEEEEKDEEEDEEEDEEVLPHVLLDHDDRARHHTSGVTSILPLPLSLVYGAPIVLTGSYDEYLRVYHATRPGRVLAEICLGGGVWRLQILNAENVDGDEWRFLVLASCMHAGTRVVRVSGKCSSDDQWHMEILAEFTEHQSMNYASDVWKGRGNPDELVVVSSSFYDKRVCVWRNRV